MLEDGVRDILKEFETNVINASRKNLKKLRKDVTGTLSRSISGKVKKNKNSIRIMFGMEDYGWYQDVGVSGSKQVRNNTPFSYRTKFPPRAAIDKWVVRKGAFNGQIRDKKGKFIKRKSLVYLIQRGIFEKGIKPSYFFTKPFEKYVKQLPPEILERYGLEVEALIGNMFKETFNAK